MIVKKILIIKLKVVKILPRLKDLNKSSIYQAN